MAQLPKGLRLNLADTLTGHIELLAHLFQRAGASILQTKAELEHLFLPGRQRIQHVDELLLQKGVAGRLGGFRSVLIRDKVAQVGVLLLTDGGLQRDRLLGDFQDLPYLVHRHVHLLGDFLRGRVVAQLLEELAGDPDDLVDGLHHMDRDTDGPGLVCDGAGNGLADRCV